MYLKAIVVDAVKTAANGNQYKTVTFQELSEYAQLPGSAQPVEVKTNATPHKRTLWSNQDGLFHALNVNDVTFGTIKRFEVDEYEIAQADGSVRKQQHLVAFSSVVNLTKRPVCVMGRNFARMLQPLQKNRELTLS